MMWAALITGGIAISGVTGMPSSLPRIAPLFPVVIINTLKNVPVWMIIVESPQTLDFQKTFNVG